MPRHRPKRTGSSEVDGAAPRTAGRRHPLSGHTSVAAVIGDPVAHSRSPAILNAAFAASGLDWVFVGLPVRAGMGTDAVEAMRTLGIRAMSVTMPHKSDVIEALDELSDPAERLGAVNCISRDEDRLVGHNTDGAGLLSALERDGIEVRDARVVVLGAGGAARAAVAALGDSGAAEVVVCNRSHARGEAAAALSPVARPVSPGDADAMSSLIASVVVSADLLINATPVGMGPADPSPVPPEAMHRGLSVVDLIYHPADTPLLRAARTAGAEVASNGIGMLVGQAAEAFGIWTGVEAPIEAMSEAARELVDPEN